MQGLVEDVMYVSRVRYQCQLKECWSSVDLWLAPDLTSLSDKLVGVSAYLKWIFFSNLLTPEGRGSFTLESLTNIIQWVNLIIQIIPCFTVVVYNETWWSMLNINLSYKPPSSLRITIRSGGYPRNFSRLKNLGPWWSPAGAGVRG